MIVYRLESLARHTVFFGKAFNTSGGASARKILDANFLARDGLTTTAKYLFNLLRDFDLTPGQTEVVIHLGNFLESNSHDVFLLKGHAGTGKTFLIDALVKLLQAQRRTYALSAPTGRAAKVIQEKTQADASTIHGMIYDFDKIEEHKTEGVEGSETYKLIVSMSVNDAPADTVFITDEASLISDQYSEAEFFQFGSGHVLRDLMYFVNFDNNEHRKKLILIGDDAQLPPVGMSFSPALSTDYLVENFGVRVFEYELSDVVRQKADSGILKNVQPLRESLKRGVFNKLAFDTRLTDVDRVCMEQVVSTFLEASGNRVNNSSVVITRSNAEAGMFNRSIRERLFLNQPEAAPGDKLMVVKNTKVSGIRIANGDFAFVRSISDDRKIRRVTLRRKNEETGAVEEVPVELSFREADLGLRLVDGSVVFVTTNILENLLYEDRPQLSSDENKALYVDFCQRYAALRKDPQAFRQALMDDPFFNALRVKFGYAITCHKAQGSEWDTAIVSCNSLGNPLAADNFRWLYTACTRAKSHLFLLDPPRIEVGSGIKPAGLAPSLLGASNPSANFEATPAPKRLATVDLERTVSVAPDLATPVDFREVIRQRVEALLDGAAIEIEGIEHNQYQEAYFFRHGEGQARINICYNGKLKITRVIAAQSGGLTDLLMANLSGMVGESCAALPASMPGGAPANGIQGPNFTHQFLAEFHQKLSSRMHAHAIKIVGLEQKQWFQRYSFQRFGEHAAVDIYYNGKHVFTKCQPVGHVREPSVLLCELIEILTVEMST
ncbi:ATP-dependent RecD-like DNA helicase [Pseudophaeobacter sp. TrK17]|uniref:ATP-dependent DNA helicase n=1 Tax=Pseudophaeobacter sp. TrK17 TaxID=2815167 RepID=UPI0035CFA685